MFTLGQAGRVFVLLFETTPPVTGPPAGLRSEALVPPPPPVGRCVKVCVGAQRIILLG